MPGIRSIGWSLPSTRLGVAEVAKLHGCETSALEQLGLRSKRLPGPEDHPLTLATRASRRAMDAARVTPSELDLVIFVGATRDYPAPWVGAFGILDELKAYNAMAYDLAARCPGVTDAIWTAAQQLTAGTIRCALICSGDRFDHIYLQRSGFHPPYHAVFGAGGSAVVLHADADNRVVARHHLSNADARVHDQHCPRAGGTREPPSSAALERGLFGVHNDMTLADMAATRNFLARSEVHNVLRVREQAGFESIDFLAGAVLDANDHRGALDALGLDKRNVLYTSPMFGHLGPSGVALSIGLALARGRAVGPNLVVSTRTYAYANAIAIQGQSPDLGIQVAQPDES